MYFADAHKSSFHSQQVKVIFHFLKIYTCLLVSSGCSNKIPLNNQHLVLTVSRGCSPRSRCSQSWFSVRALLLACRWSPWWREEAPDSVPLCRRSLTPSWGSILMTSSKLNYLPKVPPPNTITMTIRVSP